MASKARVSSNAAVARGVWGKRGVTACVPRSVHIPVVSLAETRAAYVSPDRSRIIQRTPH